MRRLEEEDKLKDEQQRQAAKAARSAHNSVSISESRGVAAAENAGEALPLIKVNKTNPKGKAVFEKKAFD